MSEDSSRGQLQSNNYYVRGCHGFVPWSFTFVELVQKISKHNVNNQPHKAVGSRNFAQDSISSQRELPAPQGGGHLPNMDAGKPIGNLQSTIPLVY